ncbi:hypothetical protein K8W59_01130 [Nocardioides rotundus]|uniref:cobaltochelatase CobT-related protein n=1 Tax=Nocardioides rotundus TaxID=1774216 RepID=UPI001CBF92C3|nr:hypothetical protein [Nocardioides rotundus]UAL30187.1 hypothetical protein K8W59_01130 [Nocardioides rotundus]
MSGSAARARTQHEVEELCGASARALAADPWLHFRSGRLHDRSGPVPGDAAHLHPDLDEDDYRSFRGAADGLALRVRDSDPRLHRAHAPEGDAAGLVYDLLEQYRVESLAPSALRGVGGNLRHRHETWVRDFLASGLAETTAGLLLFTVALVARSRLTREPVPESAEHALESTRFALAPLLGDDLARLRASVRDQAAFAPVARLVAERVGSSAEASTHAGRNSAARALRSRWSLFPPETDDLAPAPLPGRRRDGGPMDDYRVFTRSYDRVLRADAATPRIRLNRWREELDAAARDSGVGLNRLARSLADLLSDPGDPRWYGGAELGVVDPARLSLLVTSPEERRIFRTEEPVPVPDCAVTFLVDCSGSMRRNLRGLATLMDLMARALDLAWVPSELLGFSTGAWQGGRALRDWEAAGRPADPGRLAEQALLVFKDADTSWRRARPGIAGILREDWFREGLDGEAVEWALTRLRGRRATRRVLVVVSDGSPMERATALANGDHYLDDHLRAVVGAAEAAGDVAVAGLGVGLDLSPYYRHAVQLDLDEVTLPQAVRQTVALLARVVRR